MTKTSDYCKGCLGTINNCYYHDYAEELKCPCNVCLVKITCVVMCDDFGNFTTQYMRNELKEIALEK